MKGHRLPEDWTPTEQQMAWAKKERPDLNIEQQAAIFRDYWCDKTGKGATHINWNGTWRNWIRRTDPPKVTNVTSRYAPVTSLRRLSNDQRTENMGHHLGPILDQLGITHG